MKKVINAGSEHKPESPQPNPKQIAPINQLRSTVVFLGISKFSA
jgi:hypothetical protein